MLALFTFCLVFGQSIAKWDTPKINECKGELTYKRFQVNVSTDDRSTFYMNVTADNERDCILMCYERLHFCYSVKFVPASKDSNSEGVCYFGYYHGDCTKNDTQTDQLSDPFDQKPATTIVGCIKCFVQKPSLVQEFDDNRLGPALLIQAATLPTKYAIVYETTKSVPTTTTTTTTQEATTNLAYRELKTLNYLLAPCNKVLKYSVQPTLLVTSPTIYTSISNSLTIKGCAETCYRQQFCVSAIWRESECLLSYHRAQCTDEPLPSGYLPAVLISCIRCK